ncbi:MAG: HAD family hydrolase [bacterium]|nr:HAD family hydrolase [bacterium]
MAAPARGIATVLLDAGGVLLDLDYKYLRRLIDARRVEVTEEQLSRLEATARREIHKHVEQGGKVSDKWRDYFRIILDSLRMREDDREQVIDSLWEAHQRYGLWTKPIEGGPETVRQLKEAGYRVGVVSNAEGRVARDLESAGYAGMFETVVDSHLVGVEKPHPEIFHIAMQNMAVKPDTAVFVGDVPAVDVQGAEAAGIRPLLLDRHDLYGDLEVTRISAITELPEYLEQLGAE